MFSTGRLAPGGVAALAVSNRPQFYGKHLAIVGLSFFFLSLLPYASFVFLSFSSGLVCLSGLGWLFMVRESTVFSPPPLPYLGLPPPLPFLGGFMCIFANKIDFGGARSLGFLWLFPLPWSW